MDTDDPEVSDDNTSDSEYSNNEMCVGGEEEQPRLRRYETRSSKGNDTKKC
jgi:hypothetical protein